MSDSTPPSLSLPTYDAVTLQLSRAIASLHCISAAIDPDNPNATTAQLTVLALDAVIATLDHSLRLMKHPPAVIVPLRARPPDP